MLPPGVVEVALAGIEPGLGALDAQIALAATLDQLIKAQHIVHFLVFPRAGAVAGPRGDLRDVQRYLRIGQLAGGEDIGFGAGKPDFWLSPLGDDEGLFEAHIAFSAPDRPTVDAFFAAAVAAGAEILPGVRAVAPPCARGGAGVPLRAHLAQASA